jgi:hypothetical protein
MLTKEDLQAIKELLHANNKTLFTLWRVELAGLKKGQKRIEDKVDKIDSEERKKLKQRIEKLETSVKNLTSS